MSKTNAVSDEVEQVGEGRLATPALWLRAEGDGGEGGEGPVPRHDEGPVLAQVSRVGQVTKTEKKKKKRWLKLKKKKKKRCLKLKKNKEEKGDWNCAGRPRLRLILITGTVRFLGQLQLGAVQQAEV